MQQTSICRADPSSLNKKGGQGKSGDIYVIKYREQWQWHIVSVLRMLTFWSDNSVFNWNNGRSQRPLHIPVV